ncbi:MAG: GNAT family N-acetyltransferase [Leptolyngbya sp. BL-A-14]
MEAEIRTETIYHQSPYLEDVIALGRANAKSLGQMPRGGFIDHAAKGHIIVALSPQNECIGYLMYRVAYQRASIVHLCIDQAWRGNHIARSLITKLIHTTRELQGIKLLCRRDYELDGMWSSFGFIARTDKPGRSKDGKLLTIWQLDHEHPNLLTMLAQQEIGSRLCAAIDANVFYDLDVDNVDRQTEDSKALLADWLQSDVELCLTDEIDNEINRYEDRIRREKLRRFAETFTRLTCNQAEFERVSQTLRKHFPEQMTANDASDFRHLARAIASNAQFFITRDGGILEKEDAIYEEFNISTLRPSDLIVRLDELRREADYQPVRLAGTSIERRLVQAGQQNLLIQSFLLYENRETKVEFQQRIRDYISHPDHFECIVIWDDREDPLALTVYERSERHELKVPMLRVRRNYPLLPTILRHLLLLSIKISAQEGRSFTRITDPYLNDSFIRAVKEDKFIQVKDGWLRANLALAKNASEISSHLNTVISELEQEYDFCLQISQALTNSDLVNDVQLLSEIERSLYPAKILDAGISTFIVPIRPEWAENLFDEELAKQGIFGANKELALRREVVYYRSAKNAGGLTAPGRILWYVSQGKHPGRYYQAQSIRACSHLDEIIIDTPKALFNRFRRLGVYTFSDVLKAANDDLETEIMAIKFSDTEIFSRPIPFKDVQSILGKRVTLQSPYKISPKEFQKLYNI